MMSPMVRGSDACEPAKRGLLLPFVIMICKVLNRCPLAHGVEIEKRYFINAYRSRAQFLTAC